jgi:hypothetical protein
MAAPSDEVTPLLINYCPDSGPLEEDGCCKSWCLQTKFSVPRKEKKKVEPKVGLMKLVSIHSQ